MINPIITAAGELIKLTFKSKNNNTIILKGHVATSWIFNAAGKYIATYYINGPIGDIWKTHSSLQKLYKKYTAGYPAGRSWPCVTSLKKLNNLIKDLSKCISEIDLPSSICCFNFFITFNEKSITAGCQTIKNNGMKDLLKMINEVYFTKPQIVKSSSSIKPKRRHINNPLK